jgi:hypothetical protein
MKFYHRILLLVLGLGLKLQFSISFFYNESRILFLFS